MITFNVVPGVMSLGNLVAKGNPASAFVKLSGAGRILEEEIRRTAQLRPQIRILNFVIMPDHVHILLFVTEPIPISVGEIVRRIKSAAASRILRIWNMTNTRIFSDGFHDRILTSKNQLKTLNNYIQDNPRRLAIRRMYPNLFKSVANIEIQGRRYDALGNIFLLKECERQPVAIHRAWSDKEYGDAKRKWAMCVRNGGVLVSPFISRAEKDIMVKTIEFGGKIIRLVNTPFSERYKPAGICFDACAAGQMLLLYPVGMIKPEDRKITRADSLQLNRLAEELSADMELSCRMKGGSYGAWKE